MYFSSTKYDPEDPIQHADVCFKIKAKYELSHEN